MFSETAPTTPPPLALTASDGTGLRLISLVARGVVEDPLAFTELHLTFQNPEQRDIEGHFDITLPPGATVSRFAMRQASGWQEGEVVELQAARRAYEDFLHRRQDPALMEKQPGNHFRARVFPIPALGHKELIVSYSQERRSAAEPYRIHLRGLPTLEQLDIRVIISTCAEAGEAGGAGGLGGTALTQRTVKLNRAQITPDADFEVPVPPPASGPRVGLRHDNLVVARVLPVAQDRPDALLDLLVLFDTSASRALGFAAEVERLGALLAALRAQAADLHLGLRCFDQEVVEIFDGPLRDLNEAHLHRVLERGAQGASDLGRALTPVHEDPRRWRRVLLISDGVPTAGPTEGHELRAAARRLGDAGVERLDALCSGGIRDEALLAELTACGLARGGVVADGELPPAELARRLGSATLSGVQVSVPGSKWVWPTRLDGVQPGDQVLVYADLQREHQLAVVLEGAEPQRVVLGEAERPLLERAWVSARIRRLLHQRDTLAESDPDLREALRKQIIDLSVRHRVLSDFTALLVLETEADYARFGIDRRALSDILTVGPTGVEVLHRGRAAPLPAAPAWTPAKADLADLRREAPPSVGGADPGAPQAELAEAPMRDVLSADQPMPVVMAMDMDLERSFAAPEPAAQAAPAASAPMQMSPAPGYAPPTGAPRPALQAAAPAPQSARHRASPAPAAPRASEQTPSVWDRVSSFLRGDNAEEEAPPPPPSQAPRPAPRRPPPAAAQPAPAQVAGPSAREAPPLQQAVQPAQEPALPYSGPLLQVMQLLRAGHAKAALDAALDWRRRAPGDVLALIALGEALEALGERRDAARVYGSIIDLFPGRADLRRFAGERLDRLGIDGAALAVDTYRKAAQQRPDHPSGHRLLAFALLRAGSFAEAFAAIAEGARRTYPDRFPGVPRILREDVGLIAAAWLRAEPAREAEIRARVRDEGAALPAQPSVRFVLNWETDANDVDFHIHDGRGGHAYYRDKRLPSGGELYADVTQGYGPECFTIEGRPGAYPYRLQAHYYSRGPMGYGMGKLEIIDHDGQGRLHFDQRPFVIMEDRAFVDLGEVTGPL